MGQVGLHGPKVIILKGRHVANVCLSCQVRYMKGGKGAISGHERKAVALAAQ
jgi:hypothetical protein